jgi:chromosome segregation ATPase|eukprot:COSAG01_NODE_10936_length_2045_cov_1.161871_3_plen_124_part_00
MGIEDVQTMTSRLKSNIQNFRQDFDEWTTSQVQHLEAMKQSQDHAMGQGDLDLTALMQQQSCLEAEVARVGQDKEVAKHEIQTIRDGLETLRAKDAAVPAKLQQRQQVFDAERTQLAQAKRRA